jgi:hypothetical protein
VALRTYIGNAEVVLRTFIVNVVLVLIFGAFLIATAGAEQVVEFGDDPSGVTLLSQDQGGVLVQVDIGSMKFRQVSAVEGDFVLVQVDGFSRSHRIGEPSLPMVNRILAVPVGADLRAQVIESEIEEVSLTDLGLTAPIFPVQPSLSKSQDPSTVPFEFERGIYRQSGYYALPLTETRDLGIMRALRLGVLSVAPVEYDPVANSLRVYKRMVIRVEYIHPNWEATLEMRGRYYSPFFEPVYNQIINYEPLPPMILDDLVTYPVKYVIIADRMFESQLQPFIEWKTKRGFNVITAYTDEIGHSNTAIKDYIRDLYTGSDPPDDPAPSFVLLVGDDQQIEAFNYGSHISDLDFCEFTNDHIPEIYYGRFSAQDPSLLQPQIDKTLEYEQYLMPDPTYLGEVTMIAGVDAYHAPTYGNGQINYGVNLYFNSDHGIYSYTWLYPDSDQPGASMAIIRTVDEGIGLINYTAHGSHDGWADPEFSTSDVRGLTNAHQYPLAIGNCCLTVTFGDNYSTPCVGEAWLQEEDKGSIGYIGGSNSTYWDEDYWWGVGYGPIIGDGPEYDQTGLGAYDGVFHDHGEPVTDHYIVNDALVFCGNMAVVESGSGMINYYWEIYHLLGDPSVMTYLGVPSANVVDHDDVILLGETSFTVEADPSSYMGLSMDGVLHGAAYVDESGAVTMDIVPFEEPGEADLVISAQNREPYITTVQIISPQGPYVMFDSCAVNDTDGNGNGMIEFGETILLGMQLVNVGPDPAVDVTATLSTDDEYVTITDDFESFGDIEGDFGTVFVPDAYAFDVSAEIPDGHVISLDLEVSCSYGSWMSEFNLTGYAPVVEFADVFINDDQGNGNGILEAGETAEMVVTLMNSGTCMAEAVTATLSDEDEYVTITDAEGSFGDLDPSGGHGDNSGDVFVVVADSEYPIGHSVDFELAVEASGGYSAGVPFILRSWESFEYNDGGWAGEGNWECGEPTSGPGSAFDGVRVWATSLGGDYSSNANDMLVTNFIEVNESSATLNFFHWYNFEYTSPNAWDGGNVSVRVLGETDWELIYPVGGYPFDEIDGLGDEPGYSDVSGEWEQAVFEIGGYEGALLQVGFRLGTDGSLTRSGWYIDAVTATGATIMPLPEMAVTPSCLTAELEPGQSTDLTLSISNPSEGILTFEIEPEIINRILRSSDNQAVSMMTSGAASDPQVKSDYERDGDLLIVTYDGPKPVEDGSGGNPAMILDRGGPDEFGYTWIDSNEPDGPRYEWIDITGDGEPLNFSDDQNRGPYDLGFSMPFYDEYFNSIRVCSNGWLSFTSTETEYSNEPIPTGDEPNNLLAPFWDDLNPSDGGMIYFYTNGVDSAIVAWIEVPHYQYSGQGIYTFEAILTADGEIVYQYESLEGEVASNTVGIEDGNGMVGLQVAYNEPYVENSLAVKFVPPTIWLTADPLSGYVMPGSSQDIAVTFDATELDEGQYLGSLNITCNDPAHPEMAAACTLTVREQTLVDDPSAAVPAKFSLSQNYPNPFNPSTSLSYALPEDCHVKIEIFDILGRRIETLVDAWQPAGNYTVLWNGEGKSSGLYFYRIDAGEFSAARKMLLLR